MSWTEHPIAQKVMVSTIVMAFGAIGGGLVLTRDTVLKNEQKIEMISSIGSKVEKISESVAEIKEDVAVLKDRSDKASQ